MAKLLSSCLGLFDIIVVLRAMNENIFFIRKWKWISCVLKAYLLHDILYEWRHLSH